ncbi:MAG: FprA family A-type flavoprotein [Eggerthellaceae bacterium]|nr:FprA family A-type flavoprotein [Eggerthellaceae bacterium]
MLKPKEIRPDVYWVGGIDWNERNFHGYTTERGSTYNAYLILDEKVTLIDTCKKPFAHEMLERIAELVDPSKIQYLISNHVEMDHSGALPAIVEAAPDVKIITSGPQGLKGLQAHFGSEYPYETVRTGDTLSIGKRTLTFYQTPMVHWPDNMATYSSYDRILFSSDAFGQHFASSKIFDDEVGLPEVLVQAKKYYANIVMPYGKNVRNALAGIRDLDYDIIAPSHGVIWRSHVADILKEYEKWSSDEPEEYALVIYDSMWHTTETMAIEIVETFMELGISVRLMDVKVNHMSDIMTEVLSAKYIAVGSPTLNSNMMPSVAAFLCYMKGLAPKGRIGIPFGSYGWAPAGPKGVASELEACGFDLVAGTLMQQWTIDEKGLKRIHDTLVDVIKPIHELALQKKETE